MVILWIMMNAFKSLIAQGYISIKEKRCMMEYHVMTSGNDQAKGDKDHPFQTISQAAAIAVAGDTVTVHPGVYREWVNPKNGGREGEPIVYQASGEGEVVITGAEVVKDWQDLGNHVWTAVVDNAIFGERNPFEVALSGDWVFPGPFTVHLGDVYLNGQSLYECPSLQAVKDAQVWPDAKYPQASRLKWYGEVGVQKTQIWANFAGLDPREASVEISVRPHCFWPSEPGRGYIWVRGFILRQASPQWAPPTDDQEGLIGPHWSKGWVIEDNVISESKCVGISIGTKAGCGHKKIEGRHMKGGTQREQEVILRALHHDWHKDCVGGHIIRNNVIHDCEQAGIVGHMGGAFCQITGNRIYNIHHKRLRHGAEVAGIKLHGALDTQIWANTIYSSYRGLWLDWQAQGTHLSRNLFFDNLSEDLFVEVCHGPYMVDHNLFLSPMNFRNMSQGGAFAHNLFAGRILVQAELSRTTPYHFPHETAMAGYSNISGGDDRFYNNVFVGDGLDYEVPIPVTFFEHLPLKSRVDKREDGKTIMDGVPADAICHLYPVGLGAYNLYPNLKDKPWWSYSEEELKDLGPKAKAFYRGEAVLPVGMAGNLYVNKAMASSHEGHEGTYENQAIDISVDVNKARVSIRIIEPEVIKGLAPRGITTGLLGRTYHADMAYEGPDGSPFTFDLDYYGHKRPMTGVTPGPFEVCRGQGVRFDL